MATAHVRELERLYAAAAADLSRWLTHGTDFQRARAAALLDQVDTITTRLGANVAEVLNEAVVEDYRNALLATDNQLRRIGLSDQDLPVKGQFDRINERAVETLVRDMQRDLAKATDQLAENARRLIRRTAQLAVADADVSRAVANGLIAGGSVRRVARNLQERFAQGEARRLVASGAIPSNVAQAMIDAADGVIQAGKVQLRIPHYAETVAVTRLSEATTIATEDRIQQAGFDLVMITGPDTDDFCNFYVGRVFSISGDSNDYPPLSEIPGEGAPFHPRCTHAEAPFIPAFATAAELRRAKEIDDDMVGVTPQEAQAAYRERDEEGRAPRPRDVTGMEAAR